jgi:hypothetical protein
MSPDESITRPAIKKSIFLHSRAGKQSVADVTTVVTIPDSNLTKLSQSGLRMMVPTRAEIRYTSSKQR